MYVEDGSDLPVGLGRDGLETGKGNSKGLQGKSLNFIVASEEVTEKIVHTPSRVARACVSVCVSPQRVLTETGGDTCLVLRPSSGRTDDRPSPGSPSRVSRSLVSRPGARHPDPTRDLLRAVEYQEAEGGVARVGPESSLVYHAVSESGPAKISPSRGQSVDPDPTVCTQTPASGPVPTPQRGIRGRTGVDGTRVGELWADHGPRIVRRPGQGRDSPLERVPDGVPP